MSDAPHEVRAEATGEVGDGPADETPRFTSPQDALANLAKVARLLDAANQRVDHLTERLDAAVDEARDAGANEDAITAAQNGATS
jgi:hypothetical protein